MRGYLLILSERIFRLESCCLKMNSIAQYIYSYQNTEERMSKEGGRISSILKDKHLECVSRYVHSRGPTSI